MGLIPRISVAFSGALWLILGSGCGQTSRDQVPGQALHGLPINTEATPRSAVGMASWAFQPIQGASSMIMDVPAGLQFTVRLEKELTTANVLVGDTWDGTLTKDTRSKDRTIWKAGTAVRGLVVQSIPGGTLFNDHGSLGIKVTILGHDYVDTPIYLVVGNERGTRNARFVDAGAGYGALMAILSDGKLQGDHALGGAAIGAVLGSFISLFPNHRNQKNPIPSINENIRTTIPIEKIVVFSLAIPVKIVSRP